MVKTGTPQKVLPIETPAISLEELNRLTSNFGTKALIGEGSYGRVFYAKLRNGEAAAIKKLDAPSQDQDNDFAAQVIIVHNLFVNLLKASVSLYLISDAIFGDNLCSYRQCQDLSMIILWS